MSPWYMDTIAANGSSSPIWVLSAFGVPFAQWGEQAKYTLHADYQRSTMMVTDPSGQAISAFDYTPLGQPSLILGTDLPRFLYTAKELDPYSGFYWLGWRAFHPVYGRFSKPDDRPGGPPTRPDALNNNVYALNNPASYLDPNGHAAISMP